jgi:hypothetical protein
VLADVYVLAITRSAALVHKFLDRFLPDRVPAASEYEIPQFADRPEVVFTDAGDCLKLCEARPNVEHALYWTNRNLFGEPQSAHVFFLPDGGMILGLSTHREEEDQQDQLLCKLQEFAESDLGYIAYELPPVRTVTEFKELVEKVSKSGG